MQKVIRRTLLAEKQFARRQAAQKLTERRDQEKGARSQAAYSRKEETSQIIEARKTRREDHDLGPLAPRRDVGDLKDRYGTIGTHRMQGKELSKEELEKRLKNVGGMHLNIVEGDRVVLLEGRDRGKIGVIKAVDKKRGECTVEGMNMADVAIPSYMITPEDPDQRPVRPLETPISLASIRLVFPLTDPETGSTRDVIVKKVVSSKIWFDKRTGAHAWTRLIPGLNIAIPWPKRDPVVEKDTPSDTLRMEVEERTFVPTLLHPPMPMSVIDELRNKYSKFRTRHDPEYIAAKMEEDRIAEEQKSLSKKMRTPLNEANRKARKERKKLGKGALTDDMLAKIGELMVKKQEVVLQNAGFSLEEPPKQGQSEPLLA